MAENDSNPPDSEGWEIFRTQFLKFTYGESSDTRANLTHKDDLLDRTIQPGAKALGYSIKFKRVLTPDELEAVKDALQDEFDVCGIVPLAVMGKTFGRDKDALFTMLMYKIDLHDRAMLEALLRHRHPVQRPESIRKPAGPDGNNFH